MIRFILALLFTFLCLYFSNISYANVESIKISKGQVISQQVSISPGFAVLFEVPKDIISFSIADPTSVTCSNMPPSTNRLLCKPLTMQEYTTNLIMITENNEFNIILSVINNGKKNAFKYIFYDPQQKPIEENVASLSQADVRAEHSNMIDTLLKDYSHEDCQARVSNDYGEIQCVEKIRLGTDLYLKFKIISKSRQSFDIVRADVVIQTLGGFTGLSIKNEAPAGVEHLFRSKNLRFNEETWGIVKLPQISLQQDQRLTLYVYTSLGKQGDLIMKIR